MPASPDSGPVDPVGSGVLDGQLGPSASTASLLSHVRMAELLSSFNDGAASRLRQGRPDSPGSPAAFVDAYSLCMLDHHGLMVPGPGGQAWVSLASFASLTSEAVLDNLAPMLVHVGNREGGSSWLDAGTPGQIIWPHPDLSGLVRLPINLLLEHQRHQVTYSMGPSNYIDLGDIRDRLLKRPVAAQTDDSPWLGYTTVCDILARELADYALRSDPCAGGRRGLSLELNLLGDAEWLAALHCRESRTFMDPRLLAAAEKGEVFIVDATDAFWTEDNIVALVAMIQCQPAPSRVGAIGVTKRMHPPQVDAGGPAAAPHPAFYARGGSCITRLGFKTPSPSTLSAGWVVATGEIHVILPTHAFNVASRRAGGPAYDRDADRVACPSGSEMIPPKASLSTGRPVYVPGGVVLLREEIRPEHRTANIMRSVAMRLALDRNGMKPFYRGMHITTSDHQQLSSAPASNGFEPEDSCTHPLFGDPEPVSLPRPRSLHVLFSMFTQVKEFTGAPSYDPGLIPAVDPLAGLCSGWAATMRSGTELGVPPSPGDAGHGPPHAD